MDATIKRYFQTEPFSRFLPSEYAGHSHTGSYDRSHDATIDRSIDRCQPGLIVPRLIVRSVTACDECSYDRSQDAAIARTMGCRGQRSIDRTIGRRPSRLIVHDRSLIATISRTISYDDPCHRYSPIVLYEQDPARNR